MRRKQKPIMTYKIVNELAPTYLSEMFTFSNGSNEYNLRQYELNLALKKNRTEYYNSSFAFTGAKLWNSLPDRVKRQSSLILRRKHLGPVSRSVFFFVILLFFVKVEN